MKPDTARSSESPTTTEHAPASRTSSSWSGRPPPSSRLSRDGNNIPPEAYEAGAAYRPYIEETHIEFMELLTPGKMLE